MASGEHALLQLPRSIHGSATGNRQAAAGIGHALAILRVVHPLPEARPRPACDWSCSSRRRCSSRRTCLAFLLVAGLPQGSLGLPQPVAHFVLPPGQVAETVENLEILALRLLLLRLGYAAASRSDSPAASAPTAAIVAGTGRSCCWLGSNCSAAGDLVFPLPQLEQFLIGRLLGARAGVSGPAAADCVDSVR